MSATNDPPRHSRPPAWRALLFAGLVYGVALAGAAAWRADSTSDFRDFWENAVHFRQTGEIAADLGVHNYLPFFTIFMLPWGLLPLPVGAALFTALSLALFAVTVNLVEDLLADVPSRRPRAATWIAAALMLPYVHSCAVLGNVGLLVLFLVVATWFLVERDREWPAGAALGLAALIKLLPGVLIVFFLLKGRWRVAAAAGIVIGVLGLGVPVAAIGPTQAWIQHQGFYRRALVDHSVAQTLTADKPRKTLYNNNALPMVVRRLLSPVDAAPERFGRPLVVNVADLPPRARVAVYATLVVALVGVSVVLTVRRPRRWPPDGPQEAATLRGQYGLWCCLMLLAAPLMWTHYLPLAYWPLAWLADRTERSRRVGRTDRVSAAALVLWLIAAALLAWPPARAAGAQLAAVAILWLALVVARLRRQA